MPGGSVNGRPFREGHDSYNKTGIPCGNPKRFQSREVIKMGVQYQTSLSKPLVGPVEDIETERERQLQNLLQKQMNTNISLKDQFKLHKKFSDGVCHQSSTDSLSGTVSLDQYKGLSQLDSYIMELKHCGLTEEEIELKLEETGHSKNKKLRLNLEPSTRETILKAIEEKIAMKKKQLKKADKFAGAKKMGRHEMDLERAITQNTDKNNIMDCLLTTSVDTHETVNSVDPMDHLPEILDSLNKQAARKKVKKRKHSDKAEAVSAEVVNSFEISDETNIRNKPRDKSVDISEERSSLSLSRNSDDHEGTVEVNKITEQCEMDSSAGCKNKDDGSSLRTLTGKLDSIPEEDIINDRLTVTQIQSLDRFKDYTPGEPSQVLYLKNLPVQVCEEDLIRLFIRFQKKDASQIVFKLMKGRMRGQAFITLDSPDTATKALQLVNGYNFKGRPIIIQYGKKPPANS